MYYNPFSISIAETNQAQQVREGLDPGSHRTCSLREACYGVAEGVKGQARLEILEEKGKWLFLQILNN